MKVIAHKVSVVLIAVILLTGVAGCERDPEPGQASRQLVDSAAVVRGDLVRPMLFSGVGQAAERAELAFQSSGVLRLRPVRIGDEVKQGDLLAALDNPDLEPGRQAAEASLARLRNEQAQAQRNVNRLTELFSEGAVGEQALEEEQTRLESLNDQIRQAAAQLTSSQDRLADSQLNAPFAGLIGQVNFEVGEFVQAGQAVLVMGGLDEMEVILELPTEIWKDLHEGQQVPVTVLGLEENYTGQVYDLGALADPATGLFPVVVRFPAGEQSRSGQRVSVEFEHIMRDVLQVPLTAIVDPIGGAPKVFVVESGRARGVAVEILGLAGQQVGIRGELSTGEQVITAGHMSLVEGQTVNVSERSVALTTGQ